MDARYARYEKHGRHEVMNNNAKINTPNLIKNYLLNTMPRISQSFDEDSVTDPHQYLLWSIGIKATQPRIEIVRTLSEQKHPISCADLYLLIQKNLPKNHQKDGQSINISSVYRTLESLVKSGVATKINMGKVHASYELVSGKIHHHHLICTECGDIEDVQSKEKCFATKLSENIINNSNKFSIVRSHSLEFFGLCKECFNK